MKEELLPCPFCGDDPLQTETADTGGELYCYNCDITWVRPWGDWNTRVESPELAQLREKLAAERDRREELEVVAAGLYLNHEEARHQMMMYKAVYIDGKEANETT